MTRRLGWDVGGAHLKAALYEHGGIAGVWQEPCPLWLGLEHLDDALSRILSAVGPVDTHSLTMTGELADIFASRADGVSRLAAFLSERLGPGLRIYAGPDGFVRPAQAAQRAALVGSANWHASAALAAQALPEALLVDMGSTTTDIVPVAGGRVRNAGYTDFERLSAGELVYQGFTRTSLMAVAASAPYRGRAVPLMAEHFATTGDAQRLIGRLDPADDLMPTADGRDKSPAASRARLARMLGLDADDATDAEWRGVAYSFVEAQLRRLHDAACLVLSRHDIGPDAPLVLAGTGRSLLARLADRLGRGTIDFAALTDVGPTLRERAGRAAPAVALAAMDQPPA